MPTQRETNPFPNSDSNKRYYTYDYWLKKTFGKKVAKIPLDAGFSCPNIDKTGMGCIYCSPRGSGDCIPRLPCIRDQYDAGRDALSSKWDTSACIAYLQAHTNTYAPAERLKEVYDAVLGLPDIVGVNIATRADCLSEPVCDLLREVAANTLLTVELGLQSSSDATAALINGGH
ncbi:MAG: TIGR01212 family radical SAM protein, partial [Clostridia bacterium]|nr:TIGR01212 family radical SAM protein [Clostridia bacterium]